MVKAEKYIQLTGNAADEKIFDAVKVDVTKGNAEPGEQISYNIKTGFEKIWLIHSLNKMSRSNDLSYKTITNSQPAPFAVSAGEADRGGMAMSFAFVQHNRVYKGKRKFQHTLEQ